MPAATILVVEDNAVNQRVLSGMLAKLGHRVHIANNGKQALLTIEQTAIDLILMDCQMPELDGYETTRRLRARKDAKRNILVIAQTASARANEVDIALACGMNDVLQNPYSLAELRAVLTHWLSPDHNGNLATRP